MRIESFLTRQGPVGLLAITGKGDQADLGSGLIGTQAACDLIAIQAGQSDIQEEHIRYPLLRDLQSIWTGMCGLHTMAFVAQGAGQHGRVVLIIVHHQDTGTDVDRICNGKRRNTIGHIRRGEQRYAHAEGAALTQSRTAGQDAFSLHFNHPFGQRKANTKTTLCSVKRTLRLLEHITYAWQYVWLKAKTIIENFKRYTTLISVAVHLDMTIGRSEFRRVRQWVGVTAMLVAKAEVIIMDVTLALDPI